MLQQSVEVDLADTPLVSNDAIGEFLSSRGSYQREFGRDAEPLNEWDKRMKVAVRQLRLLYGDQLRHIGITSKYQEGQFDNPSWGNGGKAHSLHTLCVDPTYCHLTIDNEGKTEIVTKRENDATTSGEFMTAIRKVRRMVFIGVTTTSCVNFTLRGLLDKMKRGEIPLQKIIVSSDGFAHRRSRKKDARRILDDLAKHDRIIMVPNFNDIHWSKLQMAHS